jgi:gamma-glutamyl:cysteine ligase YbdK (ATP-grasp superfamily)
MADLRTVESLARLQLAARRCGLELRLTDVPAELEELITFIGLAEALGLEPRGQAEEREERVGVEEERELDDPAV